MHICTLQPDCNVNGGVALAWCCCLSCFDMRVMIACCSPVLSVGWTALATCRAFWNSGSEICHDLWLGLDFPSGWGSFLIMDAGGSPFPHRGSIDPVSMISMIPVGRGQHSLLMSVDIARAISKRANDPRDNWWMFNSGHCTEQMITVRSSYGSGLARLCCCNSVIEVW